MTINQKKKFASTLSDAMNNISMGETTIAIELLSELKSSLMPKTVDGITVPYVVYLQAGQWMDSYGNTTQIVRIYVDGEHVKTLEFYGYGNSYEYETKDYLAENGIIPRSYFKNSSMWQAMSDLSIDYSHTMKTCERRKDLYRFRN